MPRRLVWVVNRRVLVQQVFLFADDMRAKLTSNESAKLKTVRHDLRKVSFNHSPIPPISIVPPGVPLGLAVRDMIEATQGICDASGI